MKSQKSQFSKTLFFMFVFTTILLIGCKTPVEPKNDTIIVNMTDNVTVTGPIVNLTNVTVSNETQVNTTVELNETINVTVPVNNSVIIIDPVEEESEYSEYDNTGLIDESIDDIEDLN